MKKIIRLVKRARRKNKAKNPFIVYDICVVNSTRHGKKVFEKLGVFDTRGHSKINVFRLIYWLARGVRLSGNALAKLESINIMCLGKS